MKKIVSILLACCMILSLAACGTKKNDETTTKNNSSKTETTDNNATDTTKDDTTTTPEATENAEIVDGKFVETRKITVEIYDRSNDGGTPPDTNVYAQYIKDGMLRDHNVEVEFKTVPRWGEEEAVANLLAAGDAPDICVTYSYPTILTYADMGGVIDLSQYIYDYKDQLPNLWNWLGTTNIEWDKNPETGVIWAIEAKLAVMNRVNTFVREDWLKKLNMTAPTTLEEFENMLIAFRDNAELLLGDDADQMIPFAMSDDVGWRASTLIESFIDPDITDKEYYVNGFDDRKFTQKGTKEAIRVLNKWYNDGLIWKDFSLHGDGDQTEANLEKAGYVGALIATWDQPYRDGADGVQVGLQQQVGTDAAYIAVECFKDANGGYNKFLAGPVDRKVFFPSTNDEPVASLMYLDWISQPENIQYLQIGEEGKTHEVQADGAIKILAATDEYIQNSGLNIDYTITCNGMNLVDPEISLKSRALSYSGIDASYIETADKITTNQGRIGKNVQVPAIEAEAGVGDSLTDKRNAVLNSSIVASPDKFDSVFDSGMADYLASGGQAIIDERTEKWEATYGDATMLE